MKPSAVINFCLDTIGTPIAQQSLHDRLYLCNPPLTDATGARILFKPSRITEGGKNADKKTTNVLREYRMEFHHLIARMKSSCCTI